MNQVSFGWNVEVLVKEGEHFIRLVWPDGSKSELIPVSKNVISVLSNPRWIFDQIENLKDHDPDMEEREEI